MKQNQINVRLIFSLVVIILPLSTRAQQVQLPECFYKKFQGFIRTPKAELPITLDLYVQDDSIYEGIYYYHKIKKPIHVSGRTDNRRNFQLTEYSDGKATGIFDGKFQDQSSISGIWMTPDSSIRYEFELKEHYPPGSAHFEVFHIHEQIGDCETENCFTIDIIFPAIVDHINESVQDLINQGIGADWDKQQKIVREEIEFFNEESEMYDDIGYPMDWYEYYEEKVVLNSNYILSFERYMDSYTGGAHGSHIYDLINFDLRTGDTIFLDDIFIDNYEKKLDRIADIIFRDGNDIGIDEDLSEIGYWGLDNGFHLNNNFLLTMDGLRFIFNEYEIAPYAAGAIEVFIPYSKIKHLIKPDCPVMSLVK